MEEMIITNINDETVEIEEEVNGDEEDLYSLPLYDEEGNLIQDDFIGTENEANRGELIEETDGGIEDAN
jgi:hypothetical protein